MIIARAKTLNYPPSEAPDPQRTAPARHIRQRRQHTDGVSAYIQEKRGYNYNTFSREPVDRRAAALHARITPRAASSRFPLSKSMTHTASAVFLASAAHHQRLFMKQSKPVVVRDLVSGVTGIPSAESVQRTAEGVSPRSRSVLEKSARAKVFLSVNKQ